MIKICLDPGHGGNDRSNKGPTGYIEADGMLDLVLKLRIELISTGAFEVLLTRDKDMSVGVRRRGEMAAEWKADMFISEHSNATGWSVNTTKTGSDVFYSVDLPGDKTLANIFAKAVSESMGTKNNGGRTWESKNYPGEDYLGVIDAAQDGGVPHIFLIENGFHDHKDDEAKLKNPDIRTAIAKAQAKVICEFYNVEYPKKEGIKMRELQQWEKNVIDECIKKGIINQPEKWKNTPPDEKMSVINTLSMMNNLYNSIMNKIKEEK
ncbi:MAG: N-acetylmuramoyl-L-alanine amidase [Clostridiaceae bacterium]|nr:N-acetylmuramoyl-L-alanine amidase [Clostridiaceae bacterium]